MLDAPDFDCERGLVDAEPNFVARTFKRTIEIFASALQGIAAAALECGPVQARSELRKATLGSAQVWRTHGREQAAVEILRRKRDGHAQDRAANRSLAQNFPKCLA